MNRTVKELLESITEDELIMWKHYFEEPDTDTRVEMMLAQLTSVTTNIYGAKTKLSDFMLDFSKTERKTIEERVAESAKKLAEDLEKL